MPITQFEIVFHPVYIENTEDQDMQKICYVGLLVCNMVSCTEERTQFE